LSDVVDWFHLLWASYVHLRDPEGTADVSPLVAISKMHEQNEHTGNSSSHQSAQISSKQAVGRDGWSTTQGARARNIQIYSLFEEKSSNKLSFRTSTAHHKKTKRIITRGKMKFTQLVNHAIFQNNAFPDFTITQQL